MAGSAMHDFFVKLLERTGTIRSVVILFFLAVAVVGGAEWMVLDFTYGTILSDKNARIAQLEMADRQLAGYRQKLGGASPDEARARIDAQEQELNELRQQIEPVKNRVISEDQERLMLPALRTDPSRILLLLHQGSRENVDYGNQFTKLFKDAGWMPTRLMLGGRPDHDGIRVGWHGEKNSSYMALVNALQTAHIPFEEGEFDTSGDHVVSLDVGGIPMTEYQRAVDQAN
jgi:hypothetical protein